METKENIKVGILTISDTRTPSKSNIESFDFSGHSLIELINNFNMIESAKVVEYECVTDDIEQIQAKMTEWCSKGKVDVLLSTGGTGFSPRDVTPEATLGLVQKLTPGISQAIMNESLKITPLAMLSRAVSGIYEKTLIINLPGSKKAAKECLRVIAYVIPHAVSLIRDEKEITKQFHSQLNFKVNNGPKVPECVSKVACRFRESPFPKISVESAIEILKEQAHHIDATCPTVWIFSTGDELQSNENAHNNYIRDTNLIMIKQILEQDNYMGKVVHYGIVRDNWDDLCKNFDEAFYHADIVVTSGGVSMGEKDLIKHVLKEHFQCHIHFGRVNMKPGMPTTFATLIFKEKIKFVFCLPGNPVSAGVCSHVFLLPFLRKISGRKSIINQFKATLTHTIDQLDVRPEYKRALLKYDKGKYSVSCLTNDQQSSRLLSCVGSNCLLVLPSSNIQKNVKANDIMDVIQIKDLGFDANLSNKKNLQTELYQKNDVTMSTPCSLFSIQELFDWMTEHLYIRQCENRLTILSLGYVLQSRVYSSENLPPFPASIKDGYAIKYLNDGSWSQNSNIFNVVQISLAGTTLNCQESIIEGECARISTGAPIPPGANCVVQVEDTSVVSKSPDGTVEISISVLKEPTLNENIRSIGSDISAGQLLLDEKTELGPFEIALLRSVGCENVLVYKHPTIFIIPFVNFITHETSDMIEKNLKHYGFNGNVYFYPPCKNLQDLLEKYEYLFENDDILIILDWYGEFKSSQGKCSNIETHLHVKNNDFEISLGLGTMQIRKKRVVFFNSAECGQYSIYYCLNMIIILYLRSIIGKKHCFF